MTRKKMIGTLEQLDMMISDENEEIYAYCEELLGKINNLTVEVEVARLEFGQVFDAVSDPLWIIDTKYNVLHANRAFTEFLGIEGKRDIIGGKCYNFLKMDICRSNRCPLVMIQNNKSCFEQDIEIELRKGKKVSFLMTGSRFAGIAGETVGIVLQYKNISKRKQYENALRNANRKLEELVRIDGLTQIANRRYFDESLDKELRRMKRWKKPLSLIMLDIDYFKAYNDNYGHTKGDACLKTVATVIESCLHRSHDMAARYGGEEFVCLLPETDQKGASIIADRILFEVRNCRLEHEYSPICGHVSASIGCYTVTPDSDCSPEELIMNADRLLYESKESGRNRVTANSTP